MSFFHRDPTLQFHDEQAAFPLTAKIQNFSARHKSGQTRAAAVQPWDKIKFLPVWQTLA
jgi:hypothetical protein